MPTLNYNPAPTIDPVVSPPSGLQTQRADATAFGSQIGAATEDFSRTIEQASGRLADVAIARQNIFNQVAADEASNNWQDATNKLLYGDPSIPGDTGFYGKKGRAAMDAYPDVRKRLDDMVKEHRNSLQNPMQQIRFDSETRRTRSFLMNETGRHYDRENNTWQSSVYTGKVKLAEQGMASAAANEDWQRFDDFLQTGITAATQKALHEGKDEGLARASAQEFAANAVRIKADTIGVKDPSAALQFLEANKDNLKPGEYPAIVKEFQAKAVKQEALDIAEGRPSKVNSALIPRTGMVRGGALDYATTKQYALDAGFRGEAADIITAITFPESGGNPNAHNDNPATRDDSYGITQINALAHGPKAKEALGNPKRAMELAFEISKGGTDFRPWSTYKNGTFRSYLSPTTSATGPVAVGQDQVILPPREEGQAPDQEIPGLMGELARISKDPRVQGRPDLFNAAISAVRQKYNMVYTDQQHQLRMQQQAVKAQDEKLMDGFERRMTTDSPNYPTTNEILSSNLSPDAKRTMVGFLERQTRADPMSAVSARNQMDLFRRMQEDYDGADKVVSEKQINDSYIGGNLTDTARKTLREEFRELQSATDKDLLKRKTELLKAIEIKIVPAKMVSDGLANMADPAGEERVLAWKNAVDDKIKEFRKEGKNPFTLFQRGSDDRPNPDYVGSDSFIAPFRGKDLLKNGLRDNKADPASLDLSTLPSIQQAVKEGKLSREQGIVEALKRGFVRPTVQVPLQ